MDFDWKSIVRTVAPGIASVFGTPLAGMGVTAILNAILPEDAPKPVDTEDFLTKALNGANPDMMMKLKAADQQFKLDLKRLDIDLEKFLSEQAAASTAGARELKKDWLKSEKWDYEPMLALLVVVAFGYAEYWVFYHAGVAEVKPMDAGTSVLIGRVLGTVDAAFMLLLSFRWGTSRGSERKTELAAQQKALETTAAK